MYKQKFSFILVFLIGFQVFSQNETALGKNIVKVNLAGLTFGNYQIGAERVLFKPFSVAVWYSTVPMGKAPSIYSTKYVLSIDALADLVEESEVEYNAFTAEVRVYLGKGNAKGIYFAPFYQTSKYNFKDFPFKYESDRGTTDQLQDGKGAIYRDNFGLLLGVQFNIGKHFVVDAFLGPQLASATGHLTALAPNLISNDEQNSLASNLDEVFRGETDLISEIGMIVTSRTGAHVAMKPDSWIDFRGGLSLGFRF